MSSLHRLTVNLTPRAQEALEAVAQRTGDNKTDVVNRSIQMYRWYLDEAAAGRTLCLRDGDRIAEVTIL